MPICAKQAPIAVQKINEQKRRAAFIAIGKCLRQQGVGWE